MLIRWLSVLVVLSFAGCGRGQVARDGHPAGNGNNESMGSREAYRSELANFDPFDFDFSLASIEGTTVSLADFQGKVLIVDLWGTWCPPCRDEIPHFVELYQKFHELGLEIVGINYEQGDPSTWPKLIKTFNDRNGVPYPCLLGDRATQAQVPSFLGFPTTLFIDRSGKVRLRIEGYHPYADLEAIVEVLLEESAGGAEKT